MFKRKVKEGQKGKAICKTCGQVDTTYKLLNVPFSDGICEVKDLLCGVCDKCNCMVSVPAQENDKIAKAYMVGNIQRHGLWVNDKTETNMDTDINLK